MLSVLVQIELTVSDLAFLGFQIFACWFVLCDDFGVATVLFWVVSHEDYVCVCVVFVSVCDATMLFSVWCVFVLWQ